MRLRRAAGLPEILEFVLEAPERRPGGRMTDDEHPPIAHPGPRGIVELFCLEVVGGPASAFRSCPPPIVSPLHRPDRIGRDAATRRPNPACWPKNPTNSGDGRSRSRTSYHPRFLPTCF